MMRLGLMTLLLLAPASTVAEALPPTGPTDSNTAPAADATPPELVEYVQADYPSEALAAGLTAEVLAEIDVDEGGLVSDVRIVTPAGHGFDEAAVAAMKRFVFVPAIENGQPIPATVLYRYTFFFKEAQPIPEAPPTLPPQARLSGLVTDMDGQPLAAASVLLVGLAPDAALVPPLVTDGAGRFASADLPPGGYQLDLVAIGFEPFQANETLEPGEHREVTYRLEAEAVEYETVVRGRRPPREVTRREITRREITRIPGTGGDALRSVQNLPGMARAAALSGALIVRGSAPSDTVYYFDAIPLPLLYHFGGLTSVINSDLLERIDFFPGNYSVRYGGATGGVIDVVPRTPATDRFHGYIDADIWDVGVLAETPLTKDWSVAIAARRSYIDGILTAVLPENGGFSFTTAPRYYDYQAIADWHPDEKDHLRIFAYGSDDRMVFLFNDTVPDNPNIGSGGSFAISFHQLQARWDHSFSRAVSNQLNIGIQYQTAESAMGNIFSFDLDAVPFFLRDEFAFEPSRYTVVRLGLDSSVSWGRWLGEAIATYPNEGETSDPIRTNMETIVTDVSMWSFHPAGYGEFELKPLPTLRLLYGLRADYYDYLDRTAVDPRFVTRYEVVPGTTLKGGLGLYHQPPEVPESDASYGNPDLDLPYAIHYGLGAEQRLFDDLLEVGVEGFYKDLRHLVVSSDEMVERDGERVPERFNNDGRGQVYGLETIVKLLPTDRWFGWISYTLMKSARVDHPGEDERPFDYDQTHILTIVGSLELGRGWEAGLRFRLVTGNPDTPVLGSVFDADSDVYLPIYGAINSERMPTFHQLDLRVDKKWKWELIALSVYVDVQNIYNHENAEGYSYNYDYSERQYMFGLPLLPSLGFKLEL